MPKILHFSDLHLDGGLQFGSVDPATGMNTRFLDRVKILDFIVDHAIKNKVDIVLSTGDITNTPHPSTTTIEILASRIKMLAEHKIYFCDVAGNHETHKQSGKKSVGELLRYISQKYVHISTRPELLDIEGVQIATLPWIHRSILQEKEEFKGMSKEDINAKISNIGQELMLSLIAQADETKPLITAAHCTINGAKRGQEQDIMLGADFSITASTFEDKKICYSALGHIHKHHTAGADHIIYAGSPDRVSFGEKDEEKGFTVFEVETGKRAKWEFVKTPAREFYEQSIMTDEAAYTYFPHTSDNIISPIKCNKGCILKMKVSGTKSKIDSFDFEKLEQNIKDEKPFHYQIVRDVIRNDRTEEKTDKFEKMSPVEILKKWSERKKIKKEESKQLIANAKDILNEIPEAIHSENHGGFVPLRISLKNFASHGNTEIDFSQFSLAAISGENGAGKSSLLESIAWAIWGESRAKSDDQLVKQGETEMVVELDFRVGESTYRILRKRSVKGKRGSGLLELQTQEKDKWTAISGNSIKETQEKIQMTVGISAEVFFSSAYIRQGKADDFTGAKPADRKAILAEILLLDVWGKIEEKAKEKKRELAGQTDIFEGKRQNLTEEIWKEQNEKENLFVFEAREDLAKEELETQKNTLKLLKESAQESKDRIKLRKEFSEQIELNKQKLTEINEKADSNSEKISNNRTILLDSDKIKNAVCEVKKFTTEIEQLEELRDKFLSAKSEKDKTETKKDYLQKQINDSEKENKRKTAEYQQELLDINKEGNTRCRQLKECGTDCPTCGAEDNNQKKNPHEVELKHIDSLRDKFAQKNTSLQNFILEESEKIKNLQKELAQIPTLSVPVFMPDLLTSAKTKLEQAKKTAELSSQIEIADERIKDLEKSNAEMLGEELKLISDNDKLDSKLKSIIGTDQDSEQTIKNLANGEIKLKEAETALNKVTAEKTYCEITLKKIEESKGKLTELEEENKEILIELSTLETLIEACSKKGAPAMIIEGILPDIEEVTNGILGKISNGMRVRFSATREKKSATKKEIDEGINSNIETLDIWVEDEKGEREYEMFSGGEAFRINFAIRVALSKILAQRVGTQIRFLIIDEGFGVLDEDGRTAFISAVREVSQDFDLVLAITHIPEIREAFDTKILVEKKSEGSVVTVL